ncbi:MAG: hypothetical protein E6Q38_00990 [Crocinitomicaceae bacterium]|nr:MAG: hypothetical protein E6Q38_00990 [Crocinitomicaceae bacterium]
MKRLALFLFVTTLYQGFAQDTLKICSFNIQFLGHFQTRENAVLADVVKDHDIVVVQEMVAAPVDGLYPDKTVFKADKESGAFVAEMTKRGFSYWLSEEDTGPTKNHTPTTASEWWIVFYKKEKVLPDTVRCYGFVSQPLVANATFDRVPYAFPFKAVHGKSNFTLVSVHLHPDDGKTDVIARKTELDALVSWMTTVKESNKDIFVLGDCNIYDQKEFVDYKTKNITSLNEACVSTNSLQYGNAAKGEPYDHVFYSSYSTEDLVKNSFKVVDLKAEILKLVPAGTYQLDPYVHDDFRTKFSDHLPVSFKLLTGKDTDL